MMHAFEDDILMIKILGYDFSIVLLAQLLYCMAIDKVHLISYKSSNDDLLLDVNFN